MAKKTTWDSMKKKRMASTQARAGYDKAARSFELAEQVRKLREKAGLSQAELAERMGSTQPSVARLEAGGGNPNLDTLERIASALGAELMLSFKMAKAS